MIVLQVIVSKRNDYPFRNIIEIMIIAKHFGDAEGAAHVAASLCI